MVVKQHLPNLNPGQSQVFYENPPQTAALTLRNSFCHHVDKLRFPYIVSNGCLICSFCVNLCLAAQSLGFR
jgi:hypothetical protein